MKSHLDWILVQITSLSYAYYDGLDISKMLSFLGKYDGFKLASVLNNSW